MRREIMRLIMFSIILVACHLFAFVILPMVIFAFFDDLSAIKSLGGSLIVVNFLPATLVSALSNSARVLFLSTYNFPSDFGLVVCVIAWLLLYMGIAVLWSQRYRIFARNRNGGIVK